MIVKQGEMFIVTWGEYSDYTILRLCKAICDFNLDEVAKDYQEQTEMKVNEGHFGEWLSDNNLVEFLPCKEMWLDDYSKSVEYNSPYWGMVNNE